MPVAFQCRWCKGPPLPQPWEGACPNCLGFYRPIQIYVRDGEVDGADLGTLEEGEPISAGDLLRIVTPDVQRYETGLQGLDWITHGGLPALGCAILVTAEAGTGKSTLLLQLCARLAERKVGSLYISAEQTCRELGQQFHWMAPWPDTHMTLLHETRKDGILSAIEKSRAKVFVVDSAHAIRSVTDEEGYSMATGHAHAIAQVGMDLKKLAGEKEATIFLVGHMTNEGTVAGGSRVRHMLDATLTLRRGSDSHSDPRRILQFEEKSRICPLGRRALFKLQTNALIDCGPLEHGEESDPPPREPAPSPPPRPPAPPPARKAPRAAQDRKKKKDYGPN